MKTPHSDKKANWPPGRHPRILAQSPICSLYMTAYTRGICNRPQTCVVCYICFGQELWRMWDFFPCWQSTSLVVSRMLVDPMRLLEQSQRTVCYAKTGASVSVFFVPVPQAPLHTGWQKGSGTILVLTVGCEWTLGLGYWNLL